MPSEIFNCLIPDEWTAKAMTIALHNRGQMEMAERVINCRNNRPGCDGIFPLDSLKRFRVSLMGQGWRVWIRGQHNTAKLVRTCQRLGIEFQEVKVRAAKVIGPAAAGADVKVYIYKHGVTVRLCDACQLLLELEPGIIERKRAERYNDDDH